MNSVMTRRGLLVGSIVAPAAMAASEVCAPDGYRTISTCAQACLNPRAAAQCQSKLMFPDKPSLAGRVIAGAVLGGVVAFATGNIGLLRGVLIGGIAGGLLYGLDQFDRYLATRYPDPSDYLDQHYRYWQADSVAMTGSAILPGLAEQEQWLKQALDRADRRLPINPDEAVSYDASSALLLAMSDNVVQTDKVYDMGANRAETTLGRKTRRVATEVRERNLQQRRVAQMQRQLFSSQISPTLPYALNHKR